VLAVAPGRWLADPETLRRLGIDKGVVVDGRDLAALMEGRRPGTGEWVRRGGVGGRGGGIELTFSAPTSVSVVWALVDPWQGEAVELAHARAVERAAGYLREHVPVVRRRYGGPAVEERARDLIAVEYRYTTVRGVSAGQTPDPQLHSRVVVTGAVREDDRIVAVASRPVFRAARELGAFYRSALAEELAGEGYEIEQGAGKDGRSFEIAGVPGDLCDALSGRSREVVRAAERFRARHGRAPVRAELRNPSRLDDKLATVPRTGADLKRVASAFPDTARAALPGPAGFVFAAGVLLAMPLLVGWLCWRRLRRLSTGSPLALEQLGLRRWLRDSGWIRQRTWASAGDLRRLWIEGPTAGRPYLGWIGRLPRRMLAAEREVQTLLVAPPRSGKSSGYIIPWLLDHRGPAVVTSTKRDVYEATVAYRRSIGRVWVYDPFGPETCAFSPLANSATWEGALRTAGALASAAHSENTSAAAEFWDREASLLLAPLLHAATLTRQGMDRVLHWLDTRDFAAPEQHLERAGVHAAAAQLRSVLMRDPRNRETTVMSAANLLRAYRYPSVAEAAANDLTPSAFLAGQANTIYIVAAAHHQQDLQPVILALVSSIYEAAIELSRTRGPFDPALYFLLDEAGNIAPVQALAPWLSQCGDHGITIATSWQSVAQIDHRYGKPERDAILAASTAQLFLPPLSDPTTTGYITSLLGEESITQTSHSRGSRSPDTLSVTDQSVATAPWLRQIQRGHALLIYRDLPPAVTRAPGWYEDPRFSRVRPISP